MVGHNQDELLLQFLVTSVTYDWLPEKRGSGDDLGFLQESSEIFQLEVLRAAAQRRQSALYSSGITEQNKTLHGQAPWSDYLNGLLCKSLLVVVLFLFKCSNEMIRNVFLQSQQFTVKWTLGTYFLILMHAHGWYSLAEGGNESEPWLSVELLTWVNIAASRRKHVPCCLSSDDADISLNDSDSMRKSLLYSLRMLPWRTRCTYPMIMESN